MENTILLSEAKASRIFGLLPVSTIKNETKIEPLFRKKNISNQEQKTSITINSDECTSTMNVNERVKLYHSSVLIKSTTENLERQNELENCTDLNFENKSCHNKESDISSNTSSFDMISTNLNRTKTLIHLEYANNSVTKKVLFNENEATKPNVDNSEHDINIISSKYFGDSFILKILNDPYLSNLLYGLEIKSIANIIERSLIKMRTNKYNYNFVTTSTKDSGTDSLFIKYLHEIIKEERSRYDRTGNKMSDKEFSEQNTIIPAKKLYDMLSTSELWNSSGFSIKSDMQSVHQYETICFNCDPIYEEIHEKPPPLPTNPPPILSCVSDQNFKSNKPMFLGATKYEILSYLVDAKNRVPEEPYTFKFLRHSTNEINTLEKVSEQISEVKTYNADKCMASIERNDSGIGSETSKTSRTKYQPGILENKKINLCEDCGK